MKFFPMTINEKSCCIFIVIQCLINYIFFLPAECFPDRTDVQCLHRWQKVLNPELVKGPWSKEVRSIPGIDPGGGRATSMVAERNSPAKREVQSLKSLCVGLEKSIITEVTPRDGKGIWLDNRIMMKVDYQPQGYYDASPTTYTGQNIVAVSTRTMVNI